MKNPAKKLYVNGLIAGVFSAIAMKVGFSVSLDDIKIMILSKICLVTNGVGGHLNCNAFISIVSLAVTLFTVIYLLVNANKVKRRIKLGKIVLKKWQVGLLYYGIGYILGLGFILVVFSNVTVH